MFDRFTANARSAMGNSRRECVELRQPTLGTEHVLLGILTVPDSNAVKTLRRLGVDVEDVVKTLRSELPVGMGGPDGQIPFAPAAKTVLEMTLVEAGELGHEFIGTGHLLLGVLRQARGVAGHAAEKLGVDLEAARKVVGELAAPGPKAARAEDRDIDERLRGYASDLVVAARRNWLPPIVHREREIRRCANVLARAGNTAILLEGEPGVGKTALVEGLARAVADETYPGIRSVWRLDVPRMVAGTRYRGQLEARIDGLLREARTLEATVLVLDDLHRIVDAGQADFGGWWDRFRWMMKPAIEQGEVGVIGVVDRAAAPGIRANDRGFWACFQSIVVEPPGPEQTAAILAVHAEALVRYHGVPIADGVRRAVIDLSSRHLRDCRIPSAAIELVDHALARARLDEAEIVDVDAVVASFSEMTGIDEETIRRGGLPPS